MKWSTIQRKGQDYYTNELSVLYYMIDSELFASFNDYRVCAPTVQIEDTAASVGNQRLLH